MAKNGDTKSSGNSGSTLGFEANLWAGPHKGRVFDQCYGSGGMFVQSEKFLEEHGRRVGDITVYGQESDYTIWKLARVNLAIRGIEADIVNHTYRDPQL